MRRSSALGAIAAVAALACLGACASATKTTTSETQSGARLQVVAAENFWGSIAKQLGGDHVVVTSIITNPGTDPHSYEATPRDGRFIASARYVVINGMGYDPWANKLADANPSIGRAVLDIGKMLGRKEGDNPHRWYFPADVETVSRKISSDLKTLDAADSAYFDSRLSDFETNALARYHQLIARIRSRYAGTPVGASESIFVGLAEATGLEILTPAAYMRAISEGTDPTAQDKATVDGQIRNGEIKVFVYNSQNSTPDVKALVDEAGAKHIPVTTVTETLSPATATFQEWQAAQLDRLAVALATATGK